MYYKKMLYIMLQKCPDVMAFRSGLAYRWRNEYMKLFFFFFLLTIYVYFILKQIEQNQSKS